MKRRLGPVMILVIIAACILLVFLIKSIPINPSVPTIVKMLNIQVSNEVKATSDVGSLTIDYHSIFKSERMRYLKKLKGFYQFTKEKVGYTSLTPETNGQPLQSVILSTWGSEATFLGEIMSEFPGIYPHFDPLMYMGNNRVLDSSDSVKAFHVLRQILQCNYTGLETHFESLHKSFELNTRLWRICTVFPKVCKDPRFLGAYCRIFPFQSIETDRLPAKYSEPLIADPELNVKIVLLSRDPRSTMAIRKQLDWCMNDAKCKDAKKLCQDMVSDFQTAKTLIQKYPEHFKVVRYEDLSLDPVAETKDILDFLELPFHQNVEVYLKSHARKITESTYQWLDDNLMSFDEIGNIQSQCGEAMSLWGYKEFESKDDMSGDSISPILVSPFEAA